MQIDHLRFFIATVDTGSMNSAAKLMNCTQPAISGAIKSIEKELGYELIERNHTGVVPTKKGAYVLEDARLIINYIERWQKAGKTNEDSNMVNLILAGTAQRYKLIEVVADLRSKHPDLHINLIFNPLPGGVPSLLSSGHRVALLHQIPNHIIATKRYASEHGLKIARLHSESFQLFISANNPLAQKEDIILEDLFRKQIYLYQNPNAFPYLSMLSGMGVDYSAQLFSDDDIMRAVILQGGMSIRPLSCAYHNPYVENGSIIVKPIIDCPMPVDICIIYPNSQRIFPAEKLFINHLEQAYPEFTVL